MLPGEPETLEARVAEILGVDKPDRALALALVGRQIAWGQRAVRGYPLRLSVALEGGRRQVEIPWKDIAELPDVEDPRELLGDRCSVPPRRLYLYVGTELATRFPEIEARVAAVRLPPLPYARSMSLVYEHVRPWVEAGHVPQEWFYEALTREMWGRRHYAYAWGGRAEVDGARFSVSQWLRAVFEAEPVEWCAALVRVDGWRSFGKLPTFAEEVGRVEADALSSLGYTFDQAERARQVLRMDRDEIRRLAKEGGGPILAIRHWRRKHNFGLAEAKRMVEAVLAVPEEALDGQS